MKPFVGNPAGNQSRPVELDQGAKEKGRDSFYGFRDRQRRRERVARVDLKQVASLYPAALKPNSVLTILLSFVYVSISSLGPGHSLTFQ